MVLLVRYVFIIINLTNGGGFFLKEYFEWFEDFMGRKDDHLPLENGYFAILNWKLVLHSVTWILCKEHLTLFKLADEKKSQSLVNFLINWSFKYWFLGSGLSQELSSTFFVVMSLFPKIVKKW